MFTFYARRSSHHAVRTRGFSLMGNENQINFSQNFIGMGFLHKLFNVKLSMTIHLMSLLKIQFYFVRRQKKQEPLPCVLCKKQEYNATECGHKLAEGIHNREYKKKTHHPCKKSGTNTCNACLSTWCYIGHTFPNTFNDPTSFMPEYHWEFALRIEAV